MQDGIPCSVNNGVFNASYKFDVIFSTVRWRASSEAGKCTDANGMIEWKKVKGCLQEMLTTVECNRQCTAIRGKYHPLSVWKQKGYDVDEIEKKADRKESDMLLVLLVSGSDSLSLRYQSLAFHHYSFGNSSIAAQHVCVVSGSGLSTK